jgi:hypothetical protein
MKLLLVFLIFSNQVFVDGKAFFSLQALNIGSSG